MPVLANTRHELFAQQIAAGKTQIEAHEAAGYVPDDRNASKLALRPEIQARVREITGKSAVRAEITLASLLEEAHEIQRRALEEKQLSAANQALKLKAELSGHYVQRKEDVTPRRNTKEIDARILELLGRGSEERASGTLGGTGPSREGDAALPTVPGHGTA